jgi:hypothetical protein
MGSRKAKTTRRRKVATNKRKSKRNLKRGGGVMDYLNHFWSWVTGKGDTNAPPEPNADSAASLTEAPTSPSFGTPSTDSTTEPSPFSTEATEMPDMSQEPAPMETEMPLEPPVSPEAEPNPQELAMVNNPPLEESKEESNTLPFQGFPKDDKPPSLSNGSPKEEEESPMSKLGGKKRRKTRKHRMRHNKMIKTH